MYYVHFMVVYCICENKLSSPFDLQMKFQIIIIGWNQRSCGVFRLLQNIVIELNWIELNLFFFRLCVCVYEKKKRRTVFIVSVFFIFKRRRLKGAAPKSTGEDFKNIDTF